MDKERAPFDLATSGLTNIGFRENEARRAVDIVQSRIGAVAQRGLGLVIGVRCDTAGPTVEAERPPHRAEEALPPRLNPTMRCRDQRDATCGEGRLESCENPEVSPRFRTSGEIGIGASGASIDQGGLAMNGGKNCYFTRRAVIVFGWFAALVLAGLIHDHMAVAGEHVSQSVTITDLGGGRFHASGAGGGTFHSADAIANIGCGLWADATTWAGSCYATDASGTRKTCNFSGARPGGANFWSIVSAMTSDNVISFIGTHNGNCEFITTDKNSRFAPK